MRTAPAGPEPVAAVLVALLVEVVRMLVEQAPGAVEVWVRPVVDIQHSSPEVVQLAAVVAGLAEQVELAQLPLAQPTSPRASPGSEGQLAAGEAATGK